MTNEMNEKPIVVQKYGGSSVATIEKLETIARRVVARQADGFGVVVVVSAMGNKTDELIRLASQITSNPPARELDMLLSTGERTTMALLSIAIQKCGAESISFTGSQSGIITNDSHSHARIISVRPYRIQDELARNKIVIVAGFQGTSYKNEITTLGRGGSDMTAVALAGALSAVSCEIYSDVDGVYTADPKVVIDAKKLDELSSAEMLEMAQHGAKVLHDEAVLYAHRHQIALYAKKSHVDNSSGTLIRPDGWPDFVLNAAEIRPSAIVTAKKVLWISGTVADSQRILDQIQSWDGIKIMDMVLSASHIEVLMDIWNCTDEKAFFECLQDVGDPIVFRTDVKNVTVIGQDLGRQIPFIQKMRHALMDNQVEVLSMFTQPNAITVVVDSASCGKASVVLHAFVTGDA